MGIVDEDIARVREQSDIVAIVTQHTQLRKVGQRWSGLCPFHNEKSPSFSVNQEQGLYYCFGCRASGDVITFVREVEHLDFAEAIESLAAKAGITLRYTDRYESESRKRLGVLHEAVESAVAWYHDRLLTGADAGHARGYLRSRGFDREMVERYQLGWAPGGWDEMVTALNLQRDVLVDSGLGLVNKRNRVQDFFRDRVLFPIFDDQGRAVAFGGRKLPDADGPKYQNSRENKLYNKSRTLYGLNWAKADIVASGEAIVCEGYTDVIGFFSAELPRAVATCGTALTEDHVRHLKRYTNRIVLAYDADEAGQSAAERVYEWERRHEVEIAVLALPAGTDPDELARSDPAALGVAVAGARPFLGFRIDRVLAAAQLDTPEGRARAADAALAFIRQHPNELVRDQYLMQVSDLCRVDIEALRAQLRRPAQRSGGATVPEAAASRPERGGEVSSPGPDVEVEALRLLLQRPTEVRGRLDPVLFTGGATARAFEVLDTTEDLHGALLAADPDVAGLISRTAVEETTAEVDDVVLRLIDRRGGLALAGLERRARQSGDPFEFHPVMTWLKLRLDEIRGDQPSMDAADELLAWLTEHAAELQ